MLRLRALAMIVFAGMSSAIAVAQEPLSIPAFPGTTVTAQVQPTAPIPPLAAPRSAGATNAPVAPNAAPSTGMAPGMAPGAGMPPGANMAPGTFPEPIPLGATNPGYGAGMCPPPLPPYAWPTYAPYNNLSRVAYPTAYPYEAFPFIGPYYPFPKVPPGWRSVKLEWDDGYWWFSKTANKHNWWKVRFW